MRPTHSLAALAAVGILAHPIFAVGREPRIRLGPRGTIIATHANPNRGEEAPITAGGITAGGPAPPFFPHPRPRLAGFSPLVAVTSSDRHKSNDDTYEHELQLSYVGNAINPPANANYAIGVLDTGSIADVVAGSAAEALGVTGSYLTTNEVQLGGVGDSETITAYVTWPLGLFFAGLSAIDGNGILNLNGIHGHTNVAAIAGPTVTCEGIEVLTALIGTDYIAHTNLYIRVDTPRTVIYNGAEVVGPDVAIGITSFPDHPRFISMSIRPYPPTTSNYLPDFFGDPGDEGSPYYPTLLSLLPGFIPTGGWFVTNVFLLEGEPSPTNPAQGFELLIDTGAQTSIISPGVAASLSLPLQPDFTVDVCGVSGVAEAVPGYYIDYARINAAGGALEFSRAPFVVLDLQAPDGSGPLNGILGMNFFWNRNITFEPSLTGSSFITVSDPVEFPGGDFNLDMDVDEQDGASLAGCVAGPAATTVPPDCENADVDLDLDVDLVDFAWLQRCYSGHGVPADTSCGPG